MVRKHTMWPFITYVTFIMRLRRPEIVSLPPKKQINKYLQENNWTQIHDLLLEEIERRKENKTKLDASFLGRLLLNICIKIYKAGSHKNLDDMPIYVKIIDIIMALQPSVKIKSSKTGQTALHYASAFQNPWLVTNLLEQGADINAVDDNDIFPLFIAIARNNMPVINCMLGHKPQLSIGTMSALDVAIERGDLLVIQTLLHYIQASVSGREQVDSMIQPGHILLAAEKKRFNVVDFFLNRTEATLAPEEAEAILAGLFEYMFESADAASTSQMIQQGRERYRFYAPMIERLFSMNLENDDVSNFIMNVIMLDASTLMQKLLNQYPEQVQYCEDNFLEIFASYGSMETLQVLFDKGAKWKTGAAFNRLVSEGHLSMVKQILPMEIACITAKNLQDKGQFSLPLQLACEKNHWDIVNYFLLLAEDKINYQSISPEQAGWALVSLMEFLANCNPSEIAAYRPLVDKILALKPVTNLLLNRAAALHWAVMTGSIVLVEKLLSQQLDIDQLTCQGFTSLHFAAWEGDEAMIQYLLKQGANYSLLTPCQNTPASLARQEGHAASALSIEKFARDWAMEAMLILMNVCDKENYLLCYVVFNHLQSTGYLHEKINVNLRDLREYKASKKSNRNNSITHFSLWVKPEKEEEKLVVEDTLNTTP